MFFLSRNFLAAKVNKMTLADQKAMNISMTKDDVTRLQSGGMATIDTLILLADVLNVDILEYHEDALKVRLPDLVPCNKPEVCFLACAAS